MENSRTNSTAIIVIVVLLLLIGAGAWYLLNQSSDKKNTNTQTNQPQQSTQNSNEEPVQTKAVETTQVSIEDFAFSPASIKVKKGSTVTWTNQDTVRHNVVFDDKSISSSELLDKGQTHQVTFNTVGTFKYICTPHPGMEGTVEVVE